LRQLRAPRLQLTERDIVFGRVLFHAYGLGNALNFPFNCGASTVLVPGRPTSRSILDTIERYQPTVLCLVPTLYNAILNDAGATASDLSSLRLCISAAEPLAPETWRRWKDTFGQIILDGIGSTELFTSFARTPWRRTNRVPAANLCLDMSCAFLDDEGRPVDAGETGNLFVKEPARSLLLAPARQELPHDAGRMDGDRRPLPRR
jgi:acyl-coenzyme A synthetase/AMP-(fatty) acid ligase